MISEVNALCAFLVFCCQPIEANNQKIFNVAWMQHLCGDGQKRW